MRLYNFKIKNAKEKRRANKRGVTNYVYLFFFNAGKLILSKALRKIIASGISTIITPSTNNKSGQYFEIGVSAHNCKKENPEIIEMITIAETIASIPKNKSERKGLSGLQVWYKLIAPEK